jgi:hypothetical protein
MVVSQQDAAIGFAVSHLGRSLELGPSIQIKEPLDDSRAHICMDTYWRGWDFEPEEWW